MADTPTRSPADLKLTNQAREVVTKIYCDCGKAPYWCDKSCPMELPREQEKAEP